MILDQFKLDGQIALITGAGRGLGQGAAVGLAEAGADIVGLDIISLEETEARIKALGRRFLPVTINLREASVAQLNELVEQVVKEMGRLDILVNNAGIIRRASALEFSEEYWDDVIQINLKALFFLSQAAGNVMVGQGRGKIINIASLLSFQGGILVPSYAAAKSGVAALTRGLANEWAAKGINVNAIAPGYMATDNTVPIRADEKRSQAILERIPAGRWGQPSDLMGAMVFLASSASDYVNGHILLVDGGWMAR